jgi:hypothetical protein
MKTQMVQIEPFDSLESLVEKIDRADTARVLLIDHSDNDLARNQVKMTRLLRRCLESGKQIGLVSTDPRAIGLWSEKDLSVFADVITARDEVWRTISPATLTGFNRENGKKAAPLQRLAKPAAPRQLSPAGRVIVFSIAILAVVSMIVILLPSTDVTLYLPRREEEVDYRLLVSPEYTTVSISGQIPGQWMEEDFSIIRSVDTTGTGTFASGNAVGRVVFKNLTERSVTIPTGTSVSTSGNEPVNFITTAEVRLDGRVGAAVEVDVIAKQSGPAANVAGGEIDQVDDALGVNVLVTNPEPTTGGAEEDKPIPTDADRQQLRQSALTELQKQVSDIVQSKIGMSQWIIPASFSLTDGSVENFYPAAGDPGDTLTLEMSGKARVLVVDEAAILDYIRSVADADPDRTYQTLADSIHILSIEADDARTQAPFVLQVSAGRTVLPRIQTGGIQYQISGKPVADANNILIGQFDLAQPSLISNHPGWWPWVALLPMQIHVEVK